MSWKVPPNPPSPNLVSQQVIREREGADLQNMARHCPDQRHHHLGARRDEVGAGQPVVQEPQRFIVRQDADGGQGDAEEKGEHGEVVADCSQGSGGSSGSAQMTRSITPYGQVGGQRVVKSLSSAAATIGRPNLTQPCFVVPSVARVAKYVITAEESAHAARKYSPISKLLVLSLIQPTMKGPT